MVKRMTDDPDPERATADFHGLRIARKHGIPAPEPLYLDRTGDLLGIPGIVSGFIEGKQVSYPEDVRSWAVDIARALLRVHDVRPSAEERRHIYEGRWMGLYFLRDSWPETMAGHPLTDSDFRGCPGVAGGSAARSSGIPAHGLLAGQYPVAPGDEYRGWWTGTRPLMGIRRWTWAISG